MGYAATFIAVAEDCPAEVGTVPPTSANGPSVAAVQYAVLRDQPYALTQEDVLFEAEVQRRWTANELAPRRDELREAFSEHRRQCLRASPLVQRYGWGLHFDDEGRIGLVGRESEAYQQFCEGKDGVTVLSALRSRRRA